MAGGVFCVHDETSTQRVETWLIRIMGHVGNDLKPLELIVFHATPQPKDDSNQLTRSLGEEKALGILHHQGIIGIDWLAISVRRQE